MLVFLSRRQKTIAWFLCLVIYLELVLVPLDSFAAADRPYVVNRKYDRLMPLNPEQPKTFTDASIAPKATDAITDIASTGPTQPEMQAFSSVNASNMVDLFSGDFS